VEVEEYFVGLELSIEEGFEGDNFPETLVFGVGQLVEEPVESGAY
jgi:hypothetical protein